jgi:hypothetical protein
MGEITESVQDDVASQNTTSSNDGTERSPNETDNEDQTGEVVGIVTEQGYAAPHSNEDYLKGGGEEDAVESQKDDAVSVPDANKTEEGCQHIESELNKGSGISTADESGDKDTISEFTEEDRTEQDMTIVEPGAIPLKENHTGKDDIVEIQGPSRSQANGCVQILSLLWKNALTKLRTPVATFFEFFSPLLMMLILAAAYQLSEIEYKDAATYASLSFDIPGPWFDLLNPQTIANLTQAAPSGRRNLLELDLQERMSGGLVDETKSTLFAWLESSMSRRLMDRLQDHAANVRRLQTEDDDDEPAERDNARDAYNFLDDARQQVRMPHVH